MTKMKFIDRQEYLQIYQSLLEPSSDYWLLALDGLNGVEKSELLPELAAQSLPPGSGHVQIDFDETVYCSHHSIIH